MDYISWQRDIEADMETLSLLISMVKDITPEYDYKLNQLFKVIREKEANPINPGNRKILILRPLPIRLNTSMRIWHLKQRNWAFTQLLLQAASKDGQPYRISSRK